MNNPLSLQGTFTALVTPFKSGKVDVEGLRANIRFQIESGINGRLMLGTTGESPTISKEERDLVIRTAVEESKNLTNGKVPVMVGTGCNSTKTTIEHTQRAEELGANIALVVTPYYNKPTQEGIFLHFEAVVKKTKLPVVVYNIAGRTGINIETSTMERLAKLPQIIGVKESSCNIAQIGDVIRDISQKHPNFHVMSGDDPLTFGVIALGGHGVISVLSNLTPKAIVKMVDAARKGDIVKARELHYELLPLFKGIFMETNPIPIKTAMNMRGMAAGECRLPLCELLPENKLKLKTLLKKSKVL